MATKFCGKNFLLQIEDTPASGTFSSVASLRDTSFTISNEQVDVSDKDGAPARELKNCGINSMSVSASGMFNDDATIEQIQLAGTTGDILLYKLISDAGDIFQGTFQVASYERNGPYNSTEEYSITLESAAAITYTPAP